MHIPAHDRADELENDRERTGDVASPVRDFSSEEEGHHKALKPRQIQMIAIGGAIGTGLFMGAGARLNGSGPALVLVYALRGFFGFLILRALGSWFCTGLPQAHLSRTPGSFAARKWPTRPVGCTS